MKKWLNNYFSIDNVVNEHTVIGTAYTIAAIVAAFVAVPFTTFVTLVTASLACFGLSLKKQ